MKPETKKFRLQLKEGDGEEGQVEAQIATLGVIDLHKDLTEKGAFRKQTVLMSPWNHSSGRGQAPPVGKGQIDENAVFKGSFFMQTAAGREAYETAKAIAADQFKAEWSYGFNVEDSKEETRNGETIRVLKKLDVFEVSPVIRGAGINTGTISVKSDEDCPHCGRKSEEKGERLGNLLQRLRDENETTNARLGTAARIAEGTVSQIMSGSIICPPIARLNAFARHLDVPVSRLVRAAERDGCDSYSDLDLEQLDHNESAEAEDLYLNFLETESQLHEPL